MGRKLIDKLFITLILNFVSDLGDFCIIRITHRYEALPDGARE